jgi:hypothetical protein
LVLAQRAANRLHDVHGASARIGEKHRVHIRYINAFG